MTRNMNATLTLRHREERETLLLRHCLALGAAPRQRPARARLDDAIGRDLARMLVSSLTARSTR
jgi:hypothetical protein